MNKTNATYIPDMNGWITYYERQAEELVSEDKSSITCSALLGKSEKDARVISTPSDTQVQEKTPHKYPPIEEKGKVQELQEVSPDIKSDNNMPRDMHLVSPVQSAVEQAKGIKKAKTAVKRNNTAGGSGKSKKTKKSAKTAKKSNKRDIFNYKTVT
jgi:hypothetical protein